MSRMISVLALGGLLALFAAPALADNEVGCGIGTNLMEGRKGLVAHALASFTNASTSQQFSLTSNLSGCDSSGTVTADAQLRKFAAGNIDQLSASKGRILYRTSPTDGLSGPMPGEKTALHAYDLNEREDKDRQ